MRRLLIACLFSLALLASAAPAALAAGPIKWFGRTLVDGSGNSDINQRSLRSVACTTPHFCVVGDNKGNAVRSNNPAGGPAAWKLQNIDGTNIIGAIGCAPALCVAADFNGHAMPKRVLKSGLGPRTFLFFHAPLAVGVVEVSTLPTCVPGWSIAAHRNREKQETPSRSVVPSMPR